MTRTHLAAALALVATALAGCTSDSEPAAAPSTAASSAPATRAVTGSLLLADLDGVGWDSAEGCYGISGYDDIKPGTQVVIADSAGATVGLGELGGGVVETVGAGVLKGCKFTFIVKDVPTGKRFYSVSVANRKGVQYPEAKVFGALALTLGGD